MSLCYSFVFFFFNDTATTEIYTLSLHDALPISPVVPGRAGLCLLRQGLFLRPDASVLLEQSRTGRLGRARDPPGRDRKSTRLNSSHGYISYAVFCLKKKKKYRVSHERKPIVTAT